MALRFFGDNYQFVVFSIKFDFSRLLKYVVFRNIESAIFYSMVENSHLETKEKRQFSFAPYEFYYQFLLSTTFPVASIQNILKQNQGQ